MEHEIRHGVFQHDRSITRTAIDINEVTAEHNFDQFDFTGRPGKKEKDSDAESLQIVEEGIGDRDQVFFDEEEKPPEID